MATPTEPRGMVLRIRTETTYADLRRIESTEERCTDTPRTLPISRIKVADKVFQWRLPEEDIRGSEEHVRELVRSIGTGKDSKPLDPVVVTAVGQSFYLIEGHHRIDAYRTAKWSKGVPVEVFHGSLREARDRAFTLNRKDKLPMTKEAKVEALWRRYLEGGLSWNELAAWSGLSRSLVAKMAKAEKHYRDAKEDPTDKRWREASKFDWETDDQYDYKTQAEKSAQEMAQQLRNVSNFTKKAAITARAIALLSPKMPEALAECWRTGDDGSWEFEEGVIDVDAGTAMAVVIHHLQAAGDHELARKIEQALTSLNEQYSL